MTCARCGHAVQPDLTFNTLMERYGLPQRRLFCLNQHTLMAGLPEAQPTPLSPSGRHQRKDAQ